MKLKKNKKDWIKPELTILIKGEMEEAVLGSCKNHWAWLESGPAGANCSTLSGYICSNNAAS
jgi:hypothetical protein